jgi:hypothetical protein
MPILVSPSAETRSGAPPESPVGRAFFYLSLGWKTSTLNPLRFKES